jgi:hypothetical protein
VTAAAGVTAVIKHETQAGHRPPTAQTVAPAASAKAHARVNPASAAPAGTAGRARGHAVGATTVRKATIAVTRDATRPAKALKIPGHSSHTPKASHGQSATKSHGSSAVGNAGGAPSSVHAPHVASGGAAGAAGAGSRKPATAGTGKPATAGAGRTTTTASSPARTSNPAVRAHGGQN